MVTTLITAILVGVCYWYFIGGVDSSDKGDNFPGELPSGSTTPKAKGIEPDFEFENLSRKNGKYYIPPLGSGSNSCSGSYKIVRNTNRFK